MDSDTAGGREEEDEETAEEARRKMRRETEGNEWIFYFRLTMRREERDRTRESQMQAYAATVRLTVPLINLTTSIYKSQERYQCQECRQLK